MAGEDAPNIAASPPQRDTARPLHLRTIVGGASLIALTILIAALVLIWHLRATRLSDGENAIEKLDLVLAEQTERVFDGVDIVLAELQRDLQSAGIDGLDALLQSQSVPAAHEELRLKMSAMPQLDALFIASSDGRTINSSRFYPVPPTDLSDRDYFIALRDHPELTRFVSTPSNNRLTGTRVVFMARRLSAPDGSFVGVVGAALTVSYFQDFYRDIYLGQANSVSLFRDDGAMLARYPPPPSNFDDSFRVRPAFDSFIKDQFAVIRITGTINPVPLMLAARRVPGYPLVSTVTMSEASILAPWRSQAIGIAGGGAIMVATVGLVAWLLRRQIIATDRLAGARAEIDRESEMRRQLEESMSQLEAAAEEAYLRERRLRRSEQHLTHAQELGSMGSFERDFGSNLFIWSPETYRIFGVNPDSFVPLAENILELVHVEDRERLIQVRDRLAAKFEDLIEYRIVRPDGAIRTVRRRAAATRDEHGAITGYMGIVQDVTEQHRAMVRLALLQSVSLAIAETDDFEAALAVVLKSICAVTESIYGEAWIPDLGGAELMLGPVWHLDVEKLAAYAAERRELRLRPGAGHIALAWQTRQPVWVPDLMGSAQSVQWTMLRRANRAGINSAYVVPICSGDEVLAVLRFAMLGSREWDPSFTEIIAAVAAQLGTALRQKHVERQLRQAQKMEAVGNLTGGLAHDFNNLLGVIIGNLELLRESLPPDDQEQDELSGDALEAAHRGADLTRRLLAFARRQPLQPEITDANELIGGMHKLLGRTIGENIDFRLTLAAELWPITIDPAQLEAAITNLATNARDAMPKGGYLMITTRNIHLDGDYAAMNWEVVPGDYVLVEVSDSGSGMKPEVAGRIFEPFFTTKEEGKGSGLGLSMVFGFVKQSGGHITVHSEPGHGTSFRLYLPRGAVADRSMRAAIPRPASLGGNESILVVEDNGMMRKVVTKQLAELGYEVLVAEGAAPALDIIASAQRIDLLFTDIVMPGSMDGFELADAAMRHRPALKLLFTSGFPETPPAGRLETSRLLSKPYSKQELARAIREALDEVAASQALDR